MSMANFNETDAANILDELIDRALGGESVIITRGGATIIELRALRHAPGPITEADLAWLDAWRVTPLKPLADGGGTLLLRMRDEAER